MLLPVLVKLPLILGIYQASTMYFFSGLGQKLGRGVPPYPSIDFNVGVTAEALGHRAALDLLSGAMPWWNPFEGVGTPLAGEMQSAALLPFNLLLAVPGGQLFMHLLFQMIAGVFTFLLMRRMNVLGFAAFIAGVLFQCNGTFAWLANAVINPIAFLPVILFGVEGVRAGIRGSWRWIAIGIALSLYAGFPEMAYIDGLLVSLWTVARACGLSWQLLRPMAFGIGAGVVYGVLLAAPILIAFLDYLANATAGLHQHGFFAKFHVDARYAVALFLPYVFGLIMETKLLDVIAAFWVRVGWYAGIGLIALGLLGLWGRDRRALRIGLAVWLALGWSAAYGMVTGRLFWLLPGYVNTDFSRYFGPASAMALAVLAGFALDDMANEGLAKQRYWRSIAALALLFGVSIVAAAATLEAVTNSLWFWVSCAIATLMFASLVWIGLNRWAAGRRATLLGLLVAAEAIGNFAVPTFANARHPTLALGGIAFLQEHLGYQRIFSMGAIQPNYGSYFGIAEIDDCDLPIPLKWFTFRSQHLDPDAYALMFDGMARGGPNLPPASYQLNKNLAAYKAVGVKYVVTKAGADPFTALGSGGPAARVYADPVMTIYQLADPRPYFDAPQCMVQPRSRNVALVNCPVPAALTRLELTMPGWRVWVNGKRQQITDTGEIFQQVQLPAGRSLVRYQFRPPFMQLGYIAFMFGLLMVAGGYLTDRRKSIAE